MIDDDDEIKILLRIIKREKLFGDFLPAVNILEEFGKENYSRNLSRLTSYDLVRAAAHGPRHHC